jgi:hypothetical protein
MSTPINDGGSAFPEVRSCNFDGAHQMLSTCSYIKTVGGMSLRDYFAAKALAGILANPNLTDCKASKWATDYAYEAADAMIAQRKKTP